MWKSHLKLPERKTPARISFIKHKRYKGSDMRNGFTVIELLIVIVVIGILAAVGIVSYGAYRTRAYNASVQADLESISGELEAYRARVNSANPQQRFPASVADLNTTEIQANKPAYDTALAYNMIYCVSTSGSDAYQAFKLVAQAKSGTIYVMTQDGFISNTLTTANLTASLCSTAAMGSMGLQLNGMTTGAAWASWVRSS